MTPVNRIGRIFVFLALAGIFVLRGAPSLGADKVRLILNWIPNDNHTGFYTAIEKGYYTREGLTVDVISGEGSGVSLKGVATGRAEIGLADAGALVVGRSRGLKVKIVGAFFERTPMVIFVLKSSGIQAPKGLAGRTLAAPVASTSRILFPAFAKAVGISPDSVKWLAITPAAEVPTLMTKKADAIPTYSTLQPDFENAARSVGTESRMFWYADYGLDLYGLSVIGSDEWIRAHANIIRAFLKASYEGIRWAMEHPAEGVDLLLKSRPVLDREKTLARWRLALEQRLMVSPISKKHGLGHLDPKKMEFTRSIVSEYMKVERPVTTDELYTNQFLPGILPPG